MQMNVEQKFEEELDNKFNSEPYGKKITFHSNSQVKFVQYRVSDYIDCQTKDHSVENCNVMQRILHLLIYYQQHPQVEMYDYLTLLDNYDIPTFLEDWHQAKNNHLRGKDGIAWVNNSINIKCAGIKGCEYVGRYQRDRGNDMYDNMKVEIDYKNIILMDQLDSIHTFIFHSMRRRNTR
eukprot:514435_1